MLLASKSMVNYYISTCYIFPLLFIAMHYSSEYGFCPNVLVIYVIFVPSLKISLEVYLFCVQFYFVLSVCL